MSFIRQKTYSNAGERLINVMQTWNLEFSNIHKRERMDRQTHTLRILELRQDSLAGRLVVSLIK